MPLIKFLFCPTTGWRTGYTMGRLPPLPRLLPLPSSHRYDHSHPPITINHHSPHRVNQSIIFKTSSSSIILFAFYVVSCVCLNVFVCCVYLVCFVVVLVRHQIFFLSFLVLCVTTPLTHFAVSLLLLSISLSLSLYPLSADSTVLVCVCPPVALPPGYPDLPTTS